MALTDNLVAYYKLDGNSNDSVGSNNGTDTNVSYVAGKINNCASFNGTTSGIEISSNAGLQITGDLTISAWINTSDTIGVIVAKSDGSTSTYEYEFGFNAANRLYFVSASSTYFSTESVSAPTLNDSTWKHVVVVRGGGVTKYYVNGTLYNQNITHGNITNVATSTQSVRIGRRGNPDNFYAGSIDEAGIWSRALSGTEITELYNAGAGITYPFSTPNTSNFFQLF